MQFHRVETVDGSLRVIAERLGTLQMQTLPLVLGNDRAALIDTGLGVTKELRSFVDGLAGKPVITLLTHSDPDHIGGAGLFDKIYMSNKDDELINWAKELFMRFGDMDAIPDAEVRDAVKANAVELAGFEYENINDGDEFDLGGVKLKAFAVPGHTKGSMCFVNHAERYAITGDGIGTHMWMWFERCLPISGYLEALKRFKSEIPADYRLYCGHNVNPLPEGTVDSLISCCEEIIRGETQNEVRYNVPYKHIVDPTKTVMLHHSGCAEIVYLR